MSITQLTPQQQIDAYLLAETQKREAAILYALEYIGIACINAARDEGSYKDRTGNLRNSIGYILVKDGTIHSSSTQGGAGGATAKELLNKAVANFPHGIVLIVVAGMRYAAAVEARNLNVLTSAELLAEQQVPILMKSLGFIAA